MYLRFVTERKITHDNRREGFFQAAYNLWLAPTTAHYDAKRIRALLDWFDDNLDQPDRFNHTNSKGHARRNGTAISWFRPSAEEHIAAAFEVGSILDENGVPTTLLKTRRPGFIVYEDAYQIVATPFADTAG